MASPLTTYIRGAYGKLDAVRTQLFDSFSPEPTTGDRFLLTCPDCHTRKASYVPFDSHVSCSHCGARLTPWDMLERAGMHKHEIPRMICDAAKMQFPPPITAVSESMTAPDTAAGVKRSGLSDTREAVKKVLKDCLDKSEAAKTFLVEQHSWSLDEIRRAPIGYFPSVEIVTDKLARQGIRTETAQDWGILSADHERQVCGWWEQPNGSLKFWRIGFEQSAHRGRRNQELMRKDIPCFWSELPVANSATVLIVDEPLEAAKLIANGIPAVAIDAGNITVEQASFLTESSRDLVFWATADGAGQGGAERSVLALSPYGVNLRVLVADEDWKRPDDLVSAGGTAEIRKKIDAAANGGVFLARRLASQARRADGEKAFAKGKIWRRELTGATRDGFDAELMRAGISVGHDIAEALFSAGKYIDSGDSIASACQKVANRFSVIITITPGPTGEDART